MQYFEMNQSLCQLNNAAIEQKPRLTIQDKDYFESKEEDYSYENEFEESKEVQKVKALPLEQRDFSKEHCVQNV